MFLLSEVCRSKCLGNPGHGQSTMGRILHLAENLCYSACRVIDKAAVLLAATAAASPGGASLRLLTQVATG